VPAWGQFVPVPEVNLAKRIGERINPTFEVDSNTNTRRLVEVDEIALDDGEGVIGIV